MPTSVIFEPYEVVPRLSELRLPMETMRDILEMAAGERANVTPSDPITTPGTETWRWATRFLRDSIQLKELGWIACRNSQIDGIRNDDLNMKLVVINTDASTGMPSKAPRNCAEKGPAAERMVASNAKRDQMSFFESDNYSVDPITTYDFWYFCVHTGDDYVSAEISRPSLIEARTIRSFSERVIICGPGDMPGLRRSEPIPEDFADVEKPILTRKI